MVPNGYEFGQEPTLKIYSLVTASKAFPTLAPIKLTLYKASPVLAFDQTVLISVFR